MTDDGKARRVHVGELGEIVETGAGISIVGEEIHRHWLQVQRPEEEGGHLATSKGIAGTERRVQRRVAPPGDAGGGNDFDIALVGRAVIVAEPAALRRCGIESGVLASNLTTRVGRKGVNVDVGVTAL